MAIANGSPYYMPSANILRMAADLAFLPAYYAEKEDCILVPEALDEAFITDRKTLLGIKCCVMSKDGVEISEFMIPEPWGWSPRVCNLFQKLGLAAVWNPATEELYTRLKARECLTALLPALPFVEQNILPEIGCSIEDVVYYARKGASVVKAPLSSSGRGIMFLPKVVSTKDKEWLRGVLCKQKYVMLEPLLNKEYDFAMEFYSDGTTVHFLGLSEFYIGINGEYKGNFVGQQQCIEHKLSETVGYETWMQVREQLGIVLSDLIAPLYKGYLGVDMMLYRDQQGEIRIQPCVEINLRYNMGIVSLFLSQKYITDGSRGMFSIRYFPKTEDAHREHLKLQQQYPLIIEDYKIVSGYINLTPVNSSTKFIAILIVS